MNPLRPLRFSSVVGQTQLIKNLKTSIKAAKDRKELISHVLLDGPPGLGKTTIASCIAAEHKLKFHSTISGVLDSIPAVVEFLSGIPNKSIVFIDEIHQLNKEIEEFLYPVLEDGIMEMSVINQSFTLELPPLVFIGATTDSGSLSKPFRDRFPNRYHLEYYSIKELVKIAKLNEGKLGLKLGTDAVKYIASISRGTPRVLNNHLLWLRDCKHKPTTREQVRHAFLTKNIDSLGLEYRDRKLMHMIKEDFHNHPVGLKTLSVNLGISEETIITEIEPELIRLGFLQRTSRGRQLTQTGVEYV